MKCFFKIMILGVLLTIFNACDNFLDVAPTTNVAIPSTADDYQDMLYPLSANYTADAMIGLMGDEVYWSKNFYLTQSTDVFARRAYLHEDEVFDITENPAAWNGGYNLIFTYNKVVDEVRYLTGEPLGKLLKIEAEARLYRALNYFHLAMMFAPPYAMSSETTPGIPVIVKNDVDNTTRERTPVYGVYRHILADIDTALKYLPDYATLESRFLASKIGAYGLKARVYFNMNKYPETLQALEQLFDILDTRQSPVGLKYGIVNYNQLAWKNEDGPWQGMDPVKTFPRAVLQESENIESVLTSQLNLRDPTVGSVSSFPLNAIFVSDHLLDFFTEEGDLREKYMFYERNTSGEYWDQDAPGLKLKRFGYSNAGVSMPDIYLMAAECYARAGDMVNALKYLNGLRENRIDREKYKARTSSDAGQVLRWILEERMREFIATGHRWYDMRRLWDDPVGSTMIEKIRVLDGQTYPLTKERLTIRIPEYVMQYHPDWEQNP